MPESSTLGTILLLVAPVMLFAGAYASVGLGGGTGYLAVIILIAAIKTAFDVVSLAVDISVWKWLIISSFRFKRKKYRFTA